MTEEEKKKQEAQAAQQQDEQPAAWKTGADEMRKRAGELRDYANSPVSVDTQGQRDYLQEFLDSSVAKRQQQSDADAPAREKRERKARRLAALSDGLVALSNVMGAMGGATPVTQTSMSEAHKKAVDEAVARRKALAKEYETARQNAMTLAQKQNEANIKRRQAEEKARRDAGKQADTLMMNAATLEQRGGNADRNYGLSTDKFVEVKRHNQATEADADERNSISAGKGGSGGKKDDEIWNEFAAWENSPYGDEVKAKLEQNGVTKYDHSNRSINVAVVKRINAEERRLHGAPPQSKKKGGYTAVGRSKQNKKKPGI